ncbi:MAG: sigma-70 family RNA polymerase sigma factor [Lachnospiraceae bacterium]|nr:sigma-70 family RNA polymerase sigma factor [Lachnospiraceae bacterium]
MEDIQIVALYWQRDEAAISETIQKYENYCRSISERILTDARETEECVSDTWLKAWNSIPPQRPDNLKAWLGRVVRNLALDRYRRSRAKKRDVGAEVSCSGMEELRREMWECIPAPENVEHEMDRQELAAFLNVWLRTLKESDCVLFLRRYWNGEQVKELAEERGESEGAVAKRLARLRKRLKKALEKEGYRI